jgi:hypothetical protein
LNMQKVSHVILLSRIFWFLDLHVFSCWFLFTQKSYIFRFTCFYFFGSHAKLHSHVCIFYICFKFAAKDIFSGYMIYAFIFLHILNYLTIESFFRH